MTLASIDCDNSKLDKRSQLAKLISVSEMRLETLADTTCTRIINAIRKESYMVERYGVTYMALMRTPGIGRGSAIALCQALGVSCKAVHTNPLPKRASSPHEVAREIARLITADRTSVVLSTSACAIDSCEAMVRDHHGNRFRLVVESVA